MYKIILSISILLINIVSKSEAQFTTVSVFGIVKYPSSKKQSGASVVIDSTVQGVTATEFIPVIPDKFKIRFSYPIAGKMYYSSKFGIRIHPVSGQLKLHAGVDIKAYYEPVLSIADGIVKTVAWGEREGVYVVIAHGDFESVYAHLSSVYVQPGQLVCVAEEIGISGNTGMSTSAHLHFGMKYRSQFFNPRLFLDNIAQLILKDISTD